MSDLRCSKHVRGDEVFEECIPCLVARLALAEKVVGEARKADGKLPPHSLIFDAEYYCLAEKLRAAIHAFDESDRGGN